MLITQQQQQATGLRLLPKVQSAQILQFTVQIFLNVLPQYTNVTELHRGTNLTASYSCIVIDMTFSVDEYLPKEATTVYLVYDGDSTHTLPLSDAGDRSFEIIAILLYTETQHWDGLYQLCYKLP